MIPNEPKISSELVAEHGLTPEEYQRILTLIGREPTLTELGIFSAMWNEHCSYKSSKVHLRTLPTQAPWVIQGPGENAGVIAIGDGLAIMIDANHAYDATGAIALGRRVEELNIAWFEEPVPPEDLAGYREVKAALTIPIAGGEAEFTRWGFRPLITERLVDILQPDVSATGGISETKKIADMANAFGVRVNPHVWGTGVALAASLQLIATLPHNPPGLHPIEPILEFDQSEHPIRFAVITEPIVQRDGWVAIPDGPGLGIEIDRSALAKFRAA